MKGKYSKETAISLLRDKAAFLSSMGETRCPQRCDFSEEEVVAVKAFLGPWPRALEQAGLKPVSHPEREIKRQERRRLAKRKTTAARLAAKAAHGAAAPENERAD